MHSRLGTVKNSAHAEKSKTVSDDAGTFLLFFDIRLSTKGKIPSVLASQRGSLEK